MFGFEECVVCREKRSVNASLHEIFRSVIIASHTPLPVDVIVMG